jgi:sulfonate transport system permease protein
MTVTPITYRQRFAPLVAPRWLESAASLALQARRRAGFAALALALPHAIVAVWWLAARYEWVASQILPAPDVVYATARDLIRSGQLQSELSVSLLRLAAGLVIGGAAGLVIGLVMGVSRTAEAYLSPTIRAVWLVPSLGWLPFFMLLFGIGEALKIVLIAKACFLPLLVNSFDGVRNVSPKHREVASMFGLTHFDTLRFVIWPSVLPHVLTGFRLSLSKGWQVLILVEMIASAAGIGYLMTWGRKSFQLDIVIVTMVLIGLTGWLLDRAAFAVQRRATAWASRSAG